MAQPTVTYFSNLVPPGVFPPASYMWTYGSTIVPAQLTHTVAWTPGTPPGILVPCQWLITDIFFRIETSSGSGVSAIQIQRSTSPGPFVSVNYINDIAVTIPIGLNECIGRPYTSATIDNPLVNSGDKLRPVVSLGSGASLVSFFVTLVQFQGS